MDFTKPGLPLSKSRIAKLVEERGLKRSWLNDPECPLRETETRLDLQSVSNDPFSWVADPRGVLIPWYLGGLTYWQFRPDNPPTDENTGRPKKYLFEKGYSPRCSIGPDAGPDKPVVVIEGTYQHLCALSYMVGEWTIVGIPGVASYSGGGEDPDQKWQAPPELIRLCAGRDVRAMTDADAASNLNVYVAAENLMKAIGPAAKSRLFIPPVGGGKQGLDDYIAALGDEGAAYATISGLLDDLKTKPASRKPKPNPKRGDGDEDDAGKEARRVDAIRQAMQVISTGEPIIDEDGNRVVMAGRLWMRETGGLAVGQLAQHLMASPNRPATTAQGTVAFYKDSGVYDMAQNLVAQVTAHLLGDHDSTGNTSTLEQHLDAVCTAEKRVLPVGQTGKPFVNFTNGMLHLTDNKLVDHSPDFMSTRQVPFAWDESAECPVYETWLAASVGEAQVPVIEEVMGSVFDESRPPSKALFLFGPSHSGKSTMVRLLQAMIPDDMICALTLKQLASSEFAAAELYGKWIVTPTDMPKDHVRDVSVFKQAMGADRITGNKKYGKLFTFQNSAFFAMAANAVPTIAEESNAYRNRIVPVTFPLTFEDAEDDRIEQHMLDHELPGILARWIRAWQAHRNRRRWLAPVPQVSAYFGQKSDRVTRFVSACAELDLPVEAEYRHLEREKGSGDRQWTVHHPATLEDLHNAFVQWANDEGAPSMGRPAFMERLYSLPGVKHGLRGPISPDTRVTNLTIRPRSQWADGAEQAETISDLVPVLFPGGKPVLVWDDENKRLIRDLENVTPTPEPAPNPTPEPTPENVTPITKAFKWSNPAPAAERQARPSGRKRYWT